MQNDWFFLKFLPAKMINRAMRLIVFFDLPTKTKADRRRYAQFRKFLIDHGFMMLQFSVYVRNTRNHDDLSKYIRVIEHHRPQKGDVRCLRITEKQYASIKLIIGSDEHLPDYGTDDLIEC